MNTIKISAVLTAALLTGALSATAFAAETLTTTTGSITFRKAIVDAGVAEDSEFDAIWAATSSPRLRRMTAALPTRRAM